MTDGRVELWRWDQDKRQCVVHSGTPDDAARALAARFARDAYALGAGRPRRFACCTWPRCSTPRRMPMAWTGRWTQNDPAVVEAKQFGVKTH